MSGVTGADRERARKYWLDARYGEMEEMEDVIAQVIAEEREKARAPFLAMLDVEPDIQPLWEFERGVLRGIEMTKEAIRRAAEADA